MKLIIHRKNICLEGKTQEKSANCGKLDNWVFSGFIIQRVASYFLDTFCCDFRNKNDHFSPIFEVSDGVLGDDSRKYNLKFLNLSLDFGFEKSSTGENGLV